MAVSKAAVEVGVLAGLGNLFIYNHFMPPVADVRRADQFNIDAEKSERTALLLGTGWTILVTAYTRQIETFAVAGAILVGIDFAYKHAIAVHPGTGTMQNPSQALGSEANLYPSADYSQNTEDADVNA